MNLTPEKTMMEAEIDWLYQEIKDHQEYAEELKERIKELEAQLSKNADIFGHPV